MASKIQTTLAPSRDKNLKYFHASCSTRRRINQIQKLKNEEGEWLDWQNGLAVFIKDYYVKLFSSSHTKVAGVIVCIDSKITDRQNTELLLPITEEEVKFALFQMHPDKAPGPDEMTPAFFQKHWSIVGADIMKLTRDFFETGELLRDLNETYIVLIPKNKNLVSVMELRPIALCNDLMKIITKIIANRLKEVLSVIISDTQSAFIPGRLISDNIMISYEVMHYLKRKRFGKEGYMMIKLDIIKAYDRIEWEFLEAMLRKMGFSEKWIHLVLCCVRTVTYNIVHGDTDIAHFIPSCGLRQGDLLSPHLFIMCAEGLSALIQKYERNQWIKGIKICRKALSISHMFFMDDSYLDCSAKMSEARRIMELLMVYERASGQKVNIDKSLVFFSINVIQYNRELVCQELQMIEPDEKSKYLGLPNLLGRKKSVLLGYLKDKIKAVIQN